MPEQVFQKFELAERQFDGSTPTRHLAGDQINVQIAYSQTERIGRAAAS